jgi:hypothetical protein
MLLMVQGVGRFDFEMSLVTRLPNQAFHAANPDAGALR